MGDVVHNLPVVGDLRAALPGCRIDWVVEKAFAALPALHPGVGEIIPVSVRRWRKHPFARETREEFSRLRARLRSVRYDAVIDLQGLIKSALLTWIANGFRHGFDWKSAREPLAVFYDQVHAVPWSVHAVQRNRLLAAAALGYAPAETVDYGIAASADSLASIDAWLRESRLESLAVLLHATSAREKEWPEDRWVALGNKFAEQGVASVLPFGTPSEKQRSDRLAGRIRGAVVPPPMALDRLAALLSKARVVIGVDTGLSHLAVALGCPTVGLYVSTDPAATGLFGSAKAMNVGGAGVLPSVQEVAEACRALVEQR